MMTPQTAMPSQYEMSKKDAAKVRSPYTTAMVPTVQTMFRTITLFMGAF